MSNDDAIIELLKEIRDNQREDIAWRKRVTEESLRTQQEAVKGQRSGLRWQRFGLLVVALFFAAGAALIAYGFMGGGRWVQPQQPQQPPLQRIPRPDPGPIF